MPREIYELTPPQLEWLIENQSLSLTSGEALDESAKMGWNNSSGAPGGSFDGGTSQSFGGYGAQQQQQAHENGEAASAASGDYPPPYQQDGGYHHAPPHHSPTSYHHPHHSHFDEYHHSPRHHPQLAAASSSSSSSDHHHHHHGAPHDRPPLQDAGDFFKNAPSTMDTTHESTSHYHNRRVLLANRKSRDGSDEPLKTKSGKNKDSPAAVTSSGNGPDPYKHRIGKLTWEQSFENLKVYATMNGHCNVPRYFNDHPQLGSWVHRQRLKRKSPKKYGFLSPDQVNELTQLGFCWQLRGEGKEQFGPADNKKKTNVAAS
eukprot:CAMPEP_0172474984 /NCGR_PEP_ID=MMETSP1065-20121228/69634_1 /TAXON_ID=265537 /ORGANISM="Amphiprora paludosa, Strain CCMP125" /LENGTH=316 /DNA_ID=CAMNT_0013233177 /DNA_START=285 /DNA_END=1235 /DNA_ORIENTATION=-